jgi:hypothetical protein
LLRVVRSDEGADILILARSDARQAESLEEALWRAAAFADAGADMLFIDALASKEEMLAFTQLGGAAAGLPKVRLSTFGACYLAYLSCHFYAQLMLSITSCLFCCADGEHARWWRAEKLISLPLKTLQGLGLQLSAYPLFTHPILAATDLPQLM